MEIIQSEEKSEKRWRKINMVSNIYETTGRIPTDA